MQARDRETSAQTGLPLPREDNGPGFDRLHTERSLAEEHRDRLRQVKSRLDERSYEIPALLVAESIIADMLARHPMRPASPSGAQMEPPTSTEV